MFHGCWCPGWQAECCTLPSPKEPAVNQSLLSQWETVQRWQDALSRSMDSIRRSHWGPLFVRQGFEDLLWPAPWPVSNRAGAVHSTPWTVALDYCCLDFRLPLSRARVVSHPHRDSVSSALKTLTRSLLWKLSKWRRGGGRERQVLSLGKCTLTHVAPRVACPEPLGMCTSTRKGWCLSLKGHLLLLADRELHTLNELFPTY